MMTVPILVALLAADAQSPTALRVEVRSEGVAVAAAEVVVNGQTHTTNADGIVSINVAPGMVEVTIAKDGFAPVTTTILVQPGQVQPLVVDLQPQPTVEEHITVSATRTDQRIEDVATRVEVLDREEIDEKALMTPGDIVMMLNEMGGLRVQATSPSLGAAAVRIQGMRGRYTRFLSDGLPLFGQQVGGLGLLQIPPTDLGQVEVIKGVASALYGAGAMGGVVNLVSRRPGTKSTHELLVNRSSRGATDSVFFLSAPVGTNWGSTLLAGGHWQEQTDVDDDGWADLAGYSRGELRPRVFWDNHHGRSFFATVGATWESRNGGTMPASVLAATHQPYAEALDTGRFDVGLVGQTLVRDRYVLTARAAAAWQRHDHQFGDARERDRHQTTFGELAIRGAEGRHTWVVGGAIERDGFDPRDLPQFGYTYTVPGAFLQDDVELAKWLTVSASGRVDHHSQYGVFISPRVSALVRRGHWNSRLSVGTGFFGPTPLTEETESAGLTRLAIRRPLVAERGRSASLDFSRTDGPFSYTATLFASRVVDPVKVDETQYTLENLQEETTTAGIELFATLKRAPFSGTASYAYVHTRELDGATQADVPLTPRHGVALVGMWEDEKVGRIGLECYYIGRQRLETNPFRQTSEPYVLLGILVQRTFHRFHVFVNGENLTNVHQTEWDPLIRPSRGVDGRWTVDGWAPLDGRTINGGVRVEF